MRWPLRNQILAPMVGLMIAAIVGVSLLNAYMSARRTRQQIETELAQVTDTLAKSHFSLAGDVLEQMRGLVGADFLLIDAQGIVTAASTRDEALRNPPDSLLEQDKTSPALARLLTIGGRNYFHSSVDLRPRGPKTLHVLYPEASYRQAWRDVVYPPLLVGGVAILLVVGFGLAVASRVTRPLGRLRSQVDEIAQGSFRSVPVPARNDEIADLSRSVNRMSEMLAQYETEIRRNERLRTLGQLGGGIAHQIRNSVTGCRMAVELHARECSLADDSLDVAERQLELMERYLQRFLSLGRTTTSPHTRFTLQPVAEGVASLVGPTAKHVDVELRCELLDQPLRIHGDADAIEQLLVNLVVNGIEAASHLNAGVSEKSVTILLQRVGDQVELAVEDSGPGPAEEVASNLFEPFITEKPDGTGLGLSVAQEVAMTHGGEIRWCRREGKTRFVVSLPIVG